MSDTTNESLFKELDGDTLFTSAYFWEYKDPVSGRVTTRSAVGMWAWEDIGSVSTVEPEVLKELPEPRCSVIWRNDYIYLNVPYKTVATAWRKYRLRHGSSASLTFTTSN